MLSTHIKNLRQSKGFTLIELLVVVTLIAILAVAVLAAINPIEQRRKAQDTGAINTAAELISAEERFFAQYGCYSWNFTDTGCGGNETNALTATAVSSTAETGLNIPALIEAGEVKDGFAERIAAYGSGGSGPLSDYGMQIVTNGDAHQVSVFFTPRAQANIAIANGTVCGAAATEYCVPENQSN